MKESSQARRKRSERNRDLAILEKNLPTREELKRSAEILKKAALGERRYPLYDVSVG